jgi:prolyl-tRNA synthetase
MSIEKVSTPRIKTIEALANYLGIPQSKTAKAVFLIATIPEGQSSKDQLVFAIVRGDMEVNETKLANALKAKEIRPAREDAILAVGAIPGYASPVGLKNIMVVVDDIIPQSINLVAGANEDDYHLLNVNYGRDYNANIIADITAAQDGDACPNCSHPLHSVRGVEVGNIFKLGSRYSEAMGCYYLDQDGCTKPVIMGSYGIGSGRLLACIAEEHHDQKGLIWPITVAPYQVHLVELKGKNGTSETHILAEHLCADLQTSGIEVLYDDRDESPGIKFNDADLIGLPLRVTVSERSIKQGGVELNRRDQQGKNIISSESAVIKLKSEISLLEADICETIKEVSFGD